MIDLIHRYEAGGTLTQTSETFTAKPFKHLVLWPTLRSTNQDSLLYNSNAEVVAPGVRVSPTTSCGSGTPACKLNINDSDHSYFSVWTDSSLHQTNYIWQNFTNGNHVIFMDPYTVFNSGGGRNNCASPVLGICPSPLTTPGSYLQLIRLNMGYAATYGNVKMNLSRDTPLTSLSSTNQILGSNTATRFEFLVYNPVAGSFTVNLSTQNGQTMHVQWLNPTTGAITNSADYTATSSGAQSFTPPGGFTADSVLYLVDINGGPQ
jgi:hypothetical protein